MRRHWALPFALMLALASRAGAQRLWLPPDTTRNFAFEIGKGFFKSSLFEPSIDAASFTLTIQGRAPVNSKVAVTAAIPLAHISESFTGINGSPVPQSQTAFGNPWLGVEVAAERGIVLEIGVRPGIATEANSDALSLGVIDDFDRFEAWLPKITSARAMAHIGQIPERGGFVTGMFGATAAIPAASVGGTTQIYANYGVRAGVNGPGVLATLALTGRLDVSESGASLSDRTIHQLALSVEGTHGSFRPIASVRTFLKDQIRQSVSAIVTVGGTLVY